MATIVFTVIGKFLLVSGLLLGFYFLLFRNKASFRTTRIFLLAVPGVALLFSLLTVEVPKGWLIVGQATEKTAPAYTAAGADRIAPLAEKGGSGDASAVGTEDAMMKPVLPGADEATRNTGNILWIVLGLYLAAALYYQAVVLRQLHRVRLIRKHAECERMIDCTVYRSEEIRNPFSVMRSIYLGTGYAEAKQSVILAHERQHILHRHYADMVVMEIMTVMFWFNPAIWFIRRELRSVHEFQVDDSILRSGVGRENYMRTILEETAGSIPVMANGFNNSLIKKRFLKMKNGNKVTHKMWRVVLAVPFAVALLAVFSFTEKKDAPDKNPIEIASSSDSASTNVPVVYEEPDWDYRASNLTYRDGNFYNPDGVKLEEGSVRSAKKFKSKYLSHNDVTIVDGFRHSAKPSRLYTIEANRKETRVTFIVEIYWPSNWLFVDHGTCLIDPKTGDKYMVRDIEGGQEIGKMNVVMGLKGRFVEQTIIFPPLKRGVKVVDFYEPDNFDDLPDNGTNEGGQTIRGIRLVDYPPKKKGDIIR